jgi:hypothetical protein
MPTSHRRTDRAVPDRRPSAILKRFSQRRFPVSGKGPNNAAFYFFSIGGVFLFLAGLVELIFKPVTKSLEVSGTGLLFVVIAWALFG